MSEIFIAFLQCIDNGDDNYDKKSVTAIQSCKICIKLEIPSFNFDYK